MCVIPAIESKTARVFSSGACKYAAVMHRTQQTACPPAPHHQPAANNPIQSLGFFGKKGNFNKLKPINKLKINRAVVYLRNFHKSIHTRRSDSIRFSNYTQQKTTANFSQYLLRSPNKWQTRFA